MDDYDSKFNRKRIKLIKNKLNLGQAPSMNIGLDNCSGKYVARIDQDDISLSKRLERQVEFMENNDDIGVCGTWLEYIGNKTGLLKLSTDYRIIKIKLLRDTELAHPTVMIRKSILNKYGLKYDASFSPAEDYHQPFRHSPGLLTDGYYSLHIILLLHLHP